MAQTTPGRKRRENNYFEPGIRGRKTGIMLRDSGIRDEHGLEPIEGIFSSPEKPMPTSVRRKSNETTTSSEDMDVVHSSAPEPLEVLTGRKSTQENILRPPPMGRSPIKTQIGATPRRQSSMGPSTSPLRPQTTNKIISHSTPVRLLDFSMNEPRPSIERRSFEDTTKKLATPRSRTTPYKGDAIQVHEDQSPPPLPSPVPSNRDQDIVADAQAAVEWAGALFEDEEKNDQPLHENRDDHSMPILEDDPVPMPEDDPLPSFERDQSPLHDSEEPTTRSQSREASGTNRESEEARDSVPASEGAKEGQDQQDAPAKKGRQRKAPAPKVKRAASAKPRASTVEPKPAHRVRTESADADSVQHTRSGRLSYKPLDYWKGEKAIYHEHNRLATVKEIIRMDDVTPPQPKPRARAAPRGRQAVGARKRKFGVFAEEELDSFARDEVDTLEPWEKGEGVVSGEVRQWDPIVGSVTDESVEQEIALAGNKIEARDVPLASFRYAKTLTMPFFGSGIVELPPGGTKRTKNSRRMQMIFFVHIGKVKVEVAGTTFTITRGGVWQVPRGNFYSITNENDTTAKIFFAQGCEMAPEPPDPYNAVPLEQQ